MIVADFVDLIPICIHSVLNLYREGEGKDMQNSATTIKKKMGEPWAEIATQRHWKLIGLTSLAEDKNEVEMDTVKNAFEGKEHPKSDAVRNCSYVSTVHSSRMHESLTQALSKQMK